MDTIATLNSIVQILCQHPDIANPESPVCLAYKTAQNAIGSKKEWNQQTISIIWSVVDVQECRPDLDENQAFKVLQLLKLYHDANHGISWEVIEAMAASLYGDAEEADEEEFETA